MHQHDQDQADIGSKYVDMSIQDIDLETLYGKRSDMTPMPEGKIHPGAAQGIMASNIQIA